MSASATMCVNPGKGPDQILDSDSFTCTDVNGAVKMRTEVEVKGGENVKPTSIPSKLREAAKTGGDCPALSVKRDGEVSVKHASMMCLILTDSIVSIDTIRFYNSGCNGITPNTFTQWRRWPRPSSSWDWERGGRWPSWDSTLQSGSLRI